jgi:site-specific DNA recombinase
VYSDDGISAFSGKPRTGWLKLLSDLKSGDFEVVLAVAEDRLARSSEEKIGFQSACSKYGITWHTIAGGKLDPSSAGGSMMSTITGAIAQYESAIKVERLRARFAEETALGNPLWGTRPFGYARDRLTLDPVEAPLLQEAYAVILAGGSIYSIIKGWNSRGIRTSTGKEWSYATVQQMIRRPRNAGIVMRNDEEQVGVVAAWAPIIDRADWDAAMAILSDPKRRTAPGRKQAHLAAGLAICGVCGAPMRSASVRLKGVLTPILKCSTKANLQTTTERHPTIQLDRLDPLIRAEVVSAFLVGPANLVPADGLGSPAKLDAELSIARAARARLIGLVAKDLIAEGDAAVELGEIKNREAAIEEQLSELARSSARAAMTVDLRAELFAGNTVSFNDSAKVKMLLGERFDALPIEKRRELVRTLLDIRIGLGRSIDRVAITHRIVHSLNDAEVA